MLAATSGAASRGAGDAMSEENWPSAMTGNGCSCAAVGWMFMMGFSECAKHEKIFSHNGIVEI